jgi:ubiquinone/menaquinone biosynthesis C-methylase UbiE
MMTFNLDYWIPDLSRRAVSPELMDDAACDEGLLFATLRNFVKINRLISRTRRVLRKTILADMRRRGAREISFLDIAAGGCDTGLWFARHCRRLGVKCSVFCFDNDPRILSYARQACREEPSISFIQADARNLSRMNLKVDYAFSNNFFHHLPDTDIPATLRAMRDCCRYGFVVHDLERHIAWYMGFTLISGILWRNGFTLADGRMSIRRGFKRVELESHVAKAGIDGRISRSGLGQWLITNIHT